MKKFLIYCLISYSVLLTIYYFNDNNNSYSDNSTESYLKEWALNSDYLDYDDVSIREIEKLPETSDYDYKIYADIEQGSIKCTIYLYVKLNSSETKILRVSKNDSELRNSIINDAKSRHPDWDWGM